MNDEPQATLPEPTPTPNSTPEPAPAAPVAAQEAAPASMEDTIRETYRELTGAPSAPLRGPDGKFLRANPAEVPGDSGEGAPAPDSAPTPSEAAPWDAVPNTWKKEAAAKWSALDPDVRQEIHRREEDFHKGIGQYRDAAAFGKSIFEDVAPHFDAMRQIGGTPREVLRDVLGAWRALATGNPEQKRSTLLQLASGYGISLDELNDARANAPSPAPELQPVLQRVQQLEQHITESQRAREQAEFSERVASAEKFLSDPSREYIGEVFDDMLALVRTGIAPQDAYDKAVWANPATREKVLAKQEGERKKREAAEAAAARKAAAVNVQRRGTPPSAAKAGTMEDTIRQTYRQLQGG